MPSSLVVALPIALGLLASGTALAKPDSSAPHDDLAARRDMRQKADGARREDDTRRHDDHRGEVGPQAGKLTSQAPVEKDAGEREQCKYEDGRKSHASCDAVSAEAAHEQANYAFDSLLTTGLLGAFTLFAAGLAALYAARAANEARKANLLAAGEAARAKLESREAGESTVEALKYAALSANAAAKQAEIAEDTARRQLRAYLGFRQIRVSKLTPGNCPYFHVQFHNAGQSPALDIRLRLGVLLCTTGDPDHTSVWMHADPVPSVVTLLPGQHGDTGQGHSTPVPAIDLNQIRSGRWTVIFAGWLSYRDIFGRRHRTTFKHYIDAEKLDNSGGPLIACTKGNVMN